MADNNAILGTALDEFVGAVLAKKSDKGFLENVDREFVESEVRTLKEALKKYEEMAGRMVEEKGELLGELDRQKDNQKEIFQYLNGELAKKTDEIVALEERLAEKTDELESLLRDHGHAIQEQKDASDHEAVRLKGEIAEYREKLEKVSRFIEIKETLEAQLTEKEKLLEEEAKEHATHVSDLERKHVQEKDRLKKEMLLKLRETKANLLKMTDNQLDTTTKRTIAENEQMSSELAWQSKETEKLIRRNEKLVSENAALKRELSLQKQTEDEARDRPRSCPRRRAPDDAAPASPRALPRPLAPAVCAEGARVPEDDQDAAGEAQRRRRHAARRGAARPI